MKKQIIKRFGNKRGMTFVELLVALTLLMVIILAFTPMLLYSYNNIYTAGEINELTYDAKSDVEKGLATRISTNIMYDYGTNFQNLGVASSINLRRIVSNVKANVKGTIETLFYGGKGSIHIVSAQTVNDDSDAKKVIIQVKGITFDSIVFGNSEACSRVEDVAGGWKYYASVQVFAPNDTGMSEKDAYSEINASKYLAGESAVVGTQPTVSVNGDSGDVLVTIVIRGQDLTKSPLKISFNYYDENDNPHTVEEENAVSTFLYIDPPTMILAGGTSASIGQTKDVSYYTTAGVVNNTLQVEARSLSDISVPLAGSTEFSSVRWIANDKTAGYDPYYVLTGSNGAIIKLYRPVSTSGYTRFKKVTESEELFFPVPITDAGITKVIYPVTWNGDTSHWFQYSSKLKESDYGTTETDRKEDRCWRTENPAKRATGLMSSSTVDGVNMKMFGTQAKYSYYWNGMMTEFKYRTQNRRNISYVLNEWGCSLRYLGNKKNASQFDGYQQPWNLNASSNNDHSGSWEAVYYKATGADELLGNLSWTSNWNDSTFATVAIKSMSSGSINDMLKDTSDGDSDYKNYFDSSKLTINDVVYLPNLTASDGTKGALFYVGSVAANALVTQVDNISANNETTRASTYDVGNRKPIEGWFTMYCLVGNTNGNGTTIYKAASTSTNFDDIIYYDVGTNTSYFLKSNVGGNSQDEKRPWLEQHVCEKIRNHTINPEITGVKHTIDKGNHNCTYVLDKNVRGTSSHKNNCDAGECTAVYNGKQCPQEHKKSDSIDKWGKCGNSTLYNERAIHVPKDCWCNIDHLNKNDKLYLGEDSTSPFKFTKCCCGEYHNPTLQYLIDHEPTWASFPKLGLTSSETVRERFYGYSGTLNIAGYDSIGNETTAECWCGEVHSATECQKLNHENCEEPVCDLVHTTQEEIDQLNYRVCGFWHSDCVDDGCSFGYTSEENCCKAIHTSVEEIESLNNEVIHHTMFNRGTKSYYESAELTQRYSNVLQDPNAEHAFFVTRDFASALFKDLEFTLGFSSNREYVYSRITFGNLLNSSGVSKLTEAYKSYEKYYFLSHYGDEKHKSNYTVYNTGTSDVASLGTPTDGFRFNDGDLNIKSHDYWNNPDNDYYNVWFPGECYNLVKTATKSGVTVAVGYAVSGSTYQYINSTTNKNSSTALGSIYNDGVLAACIDGSDSEGNAKDTEMVNLLYFKDNDTIDTSYLNATEPYKTAFGYRGYGTHARQSVRFTAVDLWVNDTISGLNTSRDYYAFYGDNTGRVFVSKVATGQGTVTIEDGDSLDNGGYTKFNGTINRVNYISDLSSSVTVKTSAGGNMNEVKLSNGNSLKTVFTEITSIVVSDSIIVISGKQNGDENYVVVGCLGTNGTWIYEKVLLIDDEDEQHDNGDYIINTACIMDNYYYFAGSIGSKGFLGAVQISSFTKSVAPPMDDDDIPVGTVSTTIVADCTEYVIMATGNFPASVTSIAGRGKG